jgi:peptide/nickel transport system substrate-binding protein
MDALLTYDSKQQLLPALATEYSISEDGLTYTFKLRPNVTFHNGDPFTAQDVIETWKMIMNPEFGAGSQLGWDKITDITAPDPLTVVMQTKEAYAPFLAYVAGGLGTGTPIAPAKALAAGPQAFKEAFTLAPIGTGPFKVTEARLNEQVTLERYDGYWGTKPQLDKVIYRIVPDTNTQLVQLRTGELQVAASGGALGSTEVDQALGFDTITLLEHDTMAWSHLDLKNIGFLTDTLVRQALDFATPKQQIVEQLYKGRGTVAFADQAPISWAFNPNIQPRPYDLEQAKKLLDEAGLVPGQDGVREKDGQRLEIELWGIAGDTSSQQVIQVIANSWSQIGVKTSTNFQDTSTLWGPEGYVWTDKMNACLYSWFNGNDPDDMYYWHSSQIPKEPGGAGGNAIAFFNKFSFQAEIDALTEQAVKTVDLEQRKQLYWQIQELLHREVPVIFISWGKSFPAVAKNVGGVWPSAFNRLFWNAAEWYIAE